MKTKHLILTLALAVCSCAGLQAQVTIGDTAEPVRGALLDLNSKNGVKGGLVLSNVTIDNKYIIPDGIAPPPGGWTAERKAALTGAMVYNTGTATVPAGIYIWNGQSWTTDGSASDDDEQILFTIQTTDGKYRIPTSGLLNFETHDYDWVISVDGGQANRYRGTGQKFSDAADDVYSGVPIKTPTTDEGILIEGLTNNVLHRIRITPYNRPEPGWGNAFGHYFNFSGANDANDVSNKAKLISINAPLTTMAFAPKTTESATATGMFGALFLGCTALTTPAVLKDTYKLPNTITNLEGFLCYIHGDNTSLTTPIDLRLLSGWFSNNTTISNLSYFLTYSHYYNPDLTTPIDLTPLSGWFGDHTVISHLSYFLNCTHYENASLNLTGQAIFPNWIQTLQEAGSPNTPIYKVTGAFYGTFYLSSPKEGDTGEPTFKDGSALSSIGAPTYNMQTYTNRDFEPEEDNWW